MATAKFPFTLRLIDVDEQFAPLVVLERTFEFADPHELVEEGVEIPGVQFPRPGEYRLQLTALGETLIERRLKVRSRREPEPR